MNSGTSTLHPARRALPWTLHATNIPQKPLNKITYGYLCHLKSRAHRWHSVAHKCKHPLLEITPIRPQGDTFPHVLPYVHNAKANWKQMSLRFMVHGAVDIEETLLWNVGRIWIAEMDKRKDKVIVKFFLLLQMQWLWTSWSIFPWCQVSIFLFISGHWRYSQMRVKIQTVEYGGWGTFCYTKRFYIIVKFI